ncbi:hypothetical protein F4677DRAFT_440027 [Hypoxylon crocopeplum]|nr:hypothetical protein F4677DRAFT_440027 [Hypoxylon crocopeplum]
MNLPYQYLSRLGQSSILCAAKGTSIHTFDLEAGPSFLSSWTHPLTRQAGNDKPSAQEGQNLDEQETDQPPSKKRKLDSGGKPNVEGETSQGDSKAVEAEANGNGQKKPKSERRGQQAELPFVILITATEDGSHVVAVTGQDKTLWVFEHDGKGTLKELSQRVVPKRPSSINITADGNTILSADKFGDVYSLPLIPQPTTEQTPSTPTTPSPAPASAFKPAANRFTVHSKRNLRALEEQERLLLARAKDSAQREVPVFAHEPALGHVSMITALALAAHDGRAYIITADRDEHIRVSRGPPQAHVVEAYCLGHEAFVGALSVAAARPGMLVSGGGDDELFVWEWRAGRLLGKTDLLGLVRGLVSDASKIAVSRLYSYDAGGRCYVLAICELVPAIFVFELLQDNALEHVQTLDLPGIPLDATVFSRSEESPRLVVAIDHLRSEAEGTAESADQAQSLLLFERDETGGWAHPRGIQDIADGNLDLSREELDKALYTVGNLRKTEFEDDVDGASARDSVAP